MNIGLLVLLGQWTGHGDFNKITNVTMISSNIDNKI